MPLCSAFQCKNMGVHRFPIDEKIREQWVEALCLKNWKPVSSSRLCSGHFKLDDFYVESIYTGLKHRRKNLKKGVVPSLFSFSKEAPKSKRQSRYKAKKGQARKTDPTNDVYSNHNEDIPSSEYLCIPDIDYEKVAPEANEGECVDATKTSEASKCHKCSQIDIQFLYGSISHFKNDNEAIKFYTGFESYQKFYLVYSTLSPWASKITYFSHHVSNLHYEDQFFLTLMKLRQNKTNFELSRFFCISCSTVSNIFITWVNFTYQMWNRLDIWPNGELINFYMPESFKQYDKSACVKVDGTEFPVQKPRNTLAHQTSRSTYKHSKVLVGAKPGGSLSFSPHYGESISHSHTMYDKELVSKRIEIERLIGLTKTYKILNSDLDSYVPLATKIFYICFICCNFKDDKMDKTIK